MQSDAMLNRMSKPNVFRSALMDLENADEFTANYNDWDELREEDVQCTMVNSEIWERGDDIHLKMLEDLLRALSVYCNRIPVLGFNSAKYDLNLMKARLATHLGLVDSTKSEGTFVIKRNNDYVCITTKQFQFLDMTQYLPPGTSYSKFLKTFKIDQMKGFFCYEYLDDERKLDETSLPPVEAFWSTLKGTNTLEDPQRKNYLKLMEKGHSEAECLRILERKQIPASKEQNYAWLQEIWITENMTCLKDLLVYYNNLDTAPGTQAISRLKSLYWNDLGVDIFKDAISTPGIARKILFRTAKENSANSLLFDNKNSDLYHLVKQGIVGGPSILFCRHHSAGKTFIRGNPDKPCKNCVGFDCNSLYLYNIGDFLPVSHFVRWMKEGRCFVPHKSEQYTISYDWMDYQSYLTGNVISHKLNSGREFRIHGYLVDGYDFENTTVYEFNGCYFHGCVKRNCTLNRDRSGANDKYQRTVEKETYIRRQGYNIVTMWECTFRMMCTSDNNLKQFLESRNHAFYRQFLSKTVHEQTLLHAVQEGTFFGLIQVDIEVPDDLYEHFSEMSPLFVTCKVPFSVIGPHMQQHAEKLKLSKDDRVLLVGGMKAEGMLLSSSLLQWYLKHGLKVTRIYQAVEYAKQRCFKTFVERVTKARRMGDTSPELATLSHLFKLLGNSAYGSLLLQKEKHRNCTYHHGKDTIRLQANSPRFISFEALDDEENFELLTAKRSITMDLPNVLAFTILQNAKLRMLEFHYDFLDVFVDRSNYQMLQMDTDSSYFAITGNTLDDVIKPEKREAYDSMLKDFCDKEDIEADASVHFLPRTCCVKHAKHDKRTPGLFKLESQGSEMVSLSSKTYALRVDKDTVKVSSKGLTKEHMENPMDSYTSVLADHQSRGVQNRGFRPRNNTMYSYTQTRFGLTYFYCKREVQEDGVSTRPLKLTLKPESR